ncbi:MAG TPA: hypothetical protein VIY68_13055 [Steroidobacteraceae bacterium]
MAHATREEDRLTEDDIARRSLGLRGVPGEQDTAKMTPEAGTGKEYPQDRRLRRPSRPIEKNLIGSLATNPVPRLDQATARNQTSLFVT